MPSIGELFVSLGFKWDKQNLKELNENIQNVVEGLAKVTAGATTAVGALGAFVQNASETAVKLSNMRADFGASTQAAQTFANALHQINPAVSVEEGLEKYRKFSELVKSSIAQGKGGEATGALARLGVNWHENISVEEARQDIMKNSARTLAGLSSDPATAKAMFSDLLGAAGLGGTTKLFGESEAQYQRAARFNMRDEDIDRLEEFGKATAHLSLSLTKFSNDLAGELSKTLAPAIERAAAALDSLSAFNNRHPGAAEAEGAGATFLAGAFARSGLFKNVPYVGRLISGSGGLGMVAAMAAAPWVGSDIGKGIGDDIAAGGGGSIGAWLREKFHTGNNFFERNGWNKENAAAIMATLHSESGLNPDIYGKGAGEGAGMPGEAYGIAQWHPDRQALFKKVFGRDIHGSSLEEQMQFVQWELTHTERNAASRLMSAQGGDAKFAAMKGGYERAAGWNQSNTIYIQSSESADSLARTMKREFQGQINRAYSQTNLGAQQ